MELRLVANNGNTIAVQAGRQRDDDTDAASLMLITRQIEENGAERISTICAYLTSLPSNATPNSHATLCRLSGDVWARCSSHTRTVES